MKRLISSILVVILLISFASCKTKNKQTDPIVTSAGSQDTEGKQPNDNVNDDINVQKEAADPESQLESENNNLSEIPQDNAPQTTDENTDTDIGHQSEMSAEIESTEEDDTLLAETDKPEFKTQIIVDSFNNDYSNIKTVAAYYGASDCFVGKITKCDEIVISEDTLNKYFDENFSDNYKDTHYFRLNEDFTSVVFPLNAKLYIYTVEVEKSVFSVFTQQGTTIKVIADVSDMTEEYKVGEKYLMKGTLYQYNGETVLRLLDQFRAKVNSDGTLIGLSQDAKIFEQLCTVDSFLKNENITSIFKKELTIPTEFAQSYGVPKNELVTADNHKDTLDKIIADGKKAIIAGSDFKMQLKPTEAVK